MLTICQGVIMLTICQGVIMLTICQGAISVGVYYVNYLSRGHQCGGLLC